MAGADAARFSVDTRLRDELRTSLQPEKLARPANRLFQRRDAAVEREARGCQLGKVSDSVDSITHPLAVAGHFTAMLGPISLIACTRFALFQFAFKAKLSIQGQAQMPRTRS